MKCVYMMYRLLDRTFVRLFYYPRAKFIVRKLKNDNAIEEKYRIELDNLQKKITLWPSCNIDDQVLPDVECKFDEASQMPYVVLDGKKLFYKQNYSIDGIKASIKSLLKEQHPSCPHKYVVDDFKFDDDTILVDAGSAEAMFALLNIEKAKKAIIVESDQSWIKALTKTFEPWKDKVTIINKYVSDKTMDSYVTIDDIIGEIEDDSKIFLKMDLEGYGLKALHGAKRTLEHKRCYVANACYHTQNEYDEVKCFFEDNFPQYDLSTTNGYIFPWTFRNFKYPYFRKVMLRATNWEL